jgi:predicted CXXCH cytochrome family protein
LILVSGSRFRWLLLAPLLLGLGFGASPRRADAGGARFHPAGAACQSCHLAGAQVKPEQAKLLVASQERLCGRCHPDAIKVSHPSGFIPKGKIPPEYPLDWKGDLTCSTCHTPHGNSPGLLRGSKRGRELCLACHDQKFFDKMADQGLSVISGHLNAGIRTGGADLDPYSVQCLSCHGSYGDRLGVQVDSNSVLRHSGDSLNHPIGVRYADAMRFGGFRPQAMLPKVIMLPGGRVSCVSCHEGYSQHHGKLVMPNTGSALCFQCHDL